MSNKVLKKNGYGAVSNYNKLYKNPAKALGIVITPPNLTHLMARLIQLKSTDYLLDTCAGTGAFLKVGEDCNVKHIYGVEKNKHIFQTLKSNIRNGHLIHGNSFKYSFKHTPINKILLNPPYQLPCIEFIYHALKILRPQGQMATIVPESIFVSGGKSKRSIMKKCKKYILTHCKIKAVITVNPNAFYPVATQTCIFVFKKRKHPIHLKGQKTRMFNFSNDGYRLIPKHGLVAGFNTKEKYHRLIKRVNSRRYYKDNTSLVAKLTPKNEWIYNAFWTNPLPPSKNDFKRTVADYLSFKVAAILHGKKYLFKNNEKK